MPSNGRIAAFGALIAIAVVSAQPVAQSLAPAIRARGTIRVDGRLDDALYSTNEAIGSFVHQEPDEGIPPPQSPRPVPPPTPRGDPAPPVAPATVSRDAGRATVRAIRLDQPINLDGVLDEAVYTDAPSISDFIQQVPREGVAATERTEAWVMFDGEHLYVGARCWDSAPPEQWVANEYRRDTNQLRQNDTFGVIVDTFYDRRNGFLFYTNPLGARADAAITDEGNLNTDWNPVWDVRTSRFEGGWTTELAIPFKSLRYRAGESQTWGINIRRVIRRKNEWTHLTAVPASFGIPGGMLRVSVAGTLVGLSLPKANRNFELKPYGISRVTTDFAATPVRANDPDATAGFDAKYGITANLTADATVNTDFAQVEVDEQQVNLTRFALSYPEKRDFFLEGRGLFDFGRGVPGVPGSGGSVTSLAPQVFYSRRIGLNRNRVIPIDVGGRLTGKVGSVGLGLMNIETREEAIAGAPATNFTVLRVKQDILRRSSLGAIFTNRSDSVIAPGSNQAYGVDSTFSFYQNINLGGYYAKTATAGLEGDDESYLGRFEYGGDRYGARTDYLKVGNQFNPEVGLVRRADFRRASGSLRFSPRPTRIRSVRKFTWEGGVENFVNGVGQTETRTWVAHFNTEFQNSDNFSLDGTKNYELLARPFAIAPGVIIPVGAYDFHDATITYAFGQQRPASGTVSLQVGGFYDGTLTAVSLSGARVAVLKQFSLEPSMTINVVHLPYGDFTTRLFRMRSDYAFSPRMFASALLQYNSSDNTYSTNLRYRWEYQAGSELFVVYTDERDTGTSGSSGLRNKAFVVKVNRLFRF
jgi:hypothetical protein